MSTLILKSPAKINIYLKVLKKRSDGYHELESAFQLINLYDELEASITKSEEIRIECSPNTIKLEENIILKAVQLVKSKYKVKQGIYIKLKKEIPIGAGLGGGSSNAASALLALNNLWGLEISQTDLLKLGRGLGADVPFFLNGKNAYVSGIGDKLKEKKSDNSKYILIYPNIIASTKKVFEFYSNNKKFMEDDNLQNSLLKPLLSMYPEIKSFYNKNISSFDIKLTGSGSTMFISYKDEGELEKIMEIIPINWRFFLAEAIQYSPLRGMS